MKIFVRLTLVILLLGIAALAGAVFYLRLSLPQTSGTIVVPDVRAAIEIVRDRHGIPHIFAQNSADANFALGFVHAQDRLWQMEMNRRIGAGRMAEVVGERALASDKFLRTLGIARQAAAAFEHLDNEARSALAAYAAGVNAWLRQRSGPLPPEFVLTGVVPELWTAVDSLSWVKMMAWDLSGNWRDELLRARLAKKLSPRQLDEFLLPRRDQPGTWKVETPEPAPHRIAHDSIVPPVAPELHALYADLSDEFARLAALAPPALPEGAGSNNWAVAGRFTASGKPLMANDPHLSLTAPSIWYFAHLHTPEHNVIGATFPGVPSVVLGRNDRIAWSFTNTGPDVQDLFLEKIDAADPGRYWTPDGGTRAFAVRSETIKVKNAPDVALTIRESRHGPIVSDLLKAPVEAGHALAFAWTALADDDRSFQASVKLARAGNWDDFVAALRDFHSPQQNVVYADVDGNIGFIAPGRVPVRRAVNDIRGLLPAPGWDARYDWDGFIPFDDLPRSFNPPGGKIVTANNRIVGDDYPHLIAHDWAPPYRARRIGEMLDAGARHTPATFAAIQGDIASPMMAEFLPLLRKAPAQSADAAAALQLLDDWKGEMMANQPQPLIAAAWLRELSRLVYADELGELFDEAWEQRPLFLFNVLSDRDGQGRWCDDVTTAVREDCARQIGAALNLALADLRRRYGGNMLRWRWGDAHVAEAVHRPFGRHALLGRLFDLHTATAGDVHSVNVGSYSISNAGAPYASRHAATLRAIYDLADLDGSLFIHATGQSGNRLSLHYADFVERWAAVEYLPMTTRRGEIDDGAIGVLRLQPAP